MAKVRQLANTFQPRQQQVIAPTIRVDALAPGLTEAASSLLASQQMKIDYDAQKAKAQGENASWKAEDWLNRFLVNIKSPAQLKEAFKSTPYEDIVSGINRDSDIYDSSIAQTMYRQALEVIGDGIDDEATRNSWVTSKMREWEHIEPVYQKEADRWIQEEARNTSMINLHSLWENNFGTTTPEFNDYLNGMREQGFFGLDPVDSMQAMQGIKLNYQKAEQTAVMDKILHDALMPAAQAGANQEELNIVLNGLDLSVEGQNYLTQDERDTVVKKWMNKAKNYSAVYDQKVEEGNKAWVDWNWQNIQNIKSGGELTSGERVSLAQQKVDELIGAYNKTLPNYQTGIHDMPTVSLGVPDGDELNKMINSLNSFISQNGTDTPTDNTAETNAHIILNNVLADTTLSPEAKRNAATGFYRNGAITTSYYDKTFQDIDSYTDAKYAQMYDKAVRTAAGAKWDNETTSALIDQLHGFFESAQGLSMGEFVNGAENLIQNFAEDNAQITNLVDIYNDKQLQFFAGWTAGTNRNPKEFVSKNYAAFQEQIENLNMQGLVEQEAEMFSHYTTETAVQFATGIENGAFDYIDTAGLQVDDSGKPRIVGQVVDVYGNALIAVPFIDQGGGRKPPPGFEEEPNMLRVRLFSPTTSKTMSSRVGPIIRGERRSEALNFVERTEDPAYYITFTDENGNQIQSPSSDEPHIYQTTIMAFTGRYINGQPILEQISTDPDWEARRNRGPFQY